MDSDQQPAEQKAAAVDPEDERGAIRRRAMDMLARREHARAEIESKLCRREHEPDAIEAVLDELVDDGLLSDARYADAMVVSRIQKGIGPVRIRRELSAVQVDEAEIDRALAAAEADRAVDWSALAEAARCKRFGAEIPTDFPSKAKQMRFLQRRGFDGDLLKAVFDD